MSLMPLRGRNTASIFAPMHTLRMLGGIGLTDPDGREVDAVLRQPKRMAILAYLAMPSPGTWHRRDALLGVFWSELDQARARTSLRNSLYTLRGHLPAGMIRTRGDDEVSVDPSMVTTDVAMFAGDVAAARYDDALARYRGVLLPALFIAEAAGFERWLEEERARLKALAKKAAGLLAESREDSGDAVGAAEAAERAATMDPDDEGAVRRWITLLDRSGDRAQALAIYERFRIRVSEEFGSSPSAETIALAELVRTRPTPPLQLPPAVRAPTADPEPIAIVATIVEPLAPRTGRVRGFRWMVTAAASLTVIAGLTALIANGNPTVADAARRVVVVLPTENQTGNPAQDYIASGIGDEVGRRLQRIGGLTIRSGARSEWPATVRYDLKAIGRQFGSTVLLKTTITVAGDSLELRAALVDPVSTVERSLSSRRFTVETLQDVESQLAAGVAASIFRNASNVKRGASERAVDPESHRLMLEGWTQQLGAKSNEKAKQLFLLATAKDPSNARAWAGLSSALTAQVVNESIPFDAGSERAELAANRALGLDSLQGSAWANLAFLRALKTRDASASADLIRKAKSAEPWSPEVYLVESAILRLAHHWDQSLDAIRVARQLDPFSSFYLEREATIDICADRPQKALQLLREELLTTPNDGGATFGLTRVLAQLHRYDEAISIWSKDAAATGDTVLAGVLRRSSGEQGYWDARHFDGRRILAAVRAKSARTWVSELKLTQAEFASGDTLAGFLSLEKLAHQGDITLSKLPCMPMMDEVRHSEHFEAIAKAAIALSSK